MVSIVYRKHHLSSDSHLNAISVGEKSHGGLDNPGARVESSSKFQLMWQDPNVSAGLGHHTDVADGGSPLVILEQDIHPVALHVKPTNIPLLLE
eukprot:CAMPEP_0204354860 /NCGR_PEP_ID=MMETSP0469-20131031/33712_1 /ASSEMBLY_ACC=CAM_ASM_000384 /TAXON_ID=2969 /ORGANISM="Oxyrrhis marina" /LENGTH=93 /DNA_ID=CAMNT_0051342021 /DNA_START=98 /DNA_END=379 /DNA_ORIENTATION=+